jgi:hypothetical protein
VTLNVSASKTEAKVNDGITLKAVISGTGNHRLARNPEFDIPTDFDVFDPQVTNNINQTAQGGRGTRIVETLIIPRHSGTFEIPAVAYSFFNPSTGRYQTLEGKPISIHVERSPGEETHWPHRRSGPFGHPGKCSLSWSGHPLHQNRAGQFKSGEHLSCLAQHSIF